MMLKFKGKPYELCEFLKALISDYGAKTTLKEICEKERTN